MNILFFGRNTRYRGKFCKKCSPICIFCEIVVHYEENMEKNMVLPEKVRLNRDQAMVEKLLAVLEKKGGYCPCRLKKVPENMCICEEFRQQIADPEFEGYCHCQLYYKEK